MLRTENGPMINNYRPTQPLGIRTVYVRSSATVADAVPVVAFIAHAAVFFLFAL